ncbi:MAG TPA: hypothetical protein VII82_09040 [Polyangiaceae bacterium]
MKTSFLALCLSGLAFAGCTATTEVAPTGAAPAPGCSPDSSVSGCSGNASGYSCGNGDSPEQTDSSLVCSDGTPASDGFVLYCCIQFTSSTCAPDSTVSGCDGDSIGFSCTGTDTPDQADSSLNCSDSTPGNAGALLYCCQP